MGLRDRVKTRIRNLVDRLSGEHSAVAPDPTRVETYRRPGQPNDEAEVVMARLNRPVPGGNRKTEDEQD